LLLIQPALVAIDKRS